ncbi:MAG: hypothetical protein R3F43_27635, partial [bacterium]
MATAELVALRAELTAVVAGWFAADGLRRPDGHAYTIDVAHLLEHAAWVQDAALYGRVRATVDALVLD